MIAIHKNINGFSKNWIDYCDTNKINYKIVNCYSNDIIEQINDCVALMWHFKQSDPRDIIFAKELIYSLKIAGKKVFPDFYTCWHFDDKLAQKYLLESIKAPIVPTYVFYEKEKALDWVRKSQFPKVFKLRRGASSAHVHLVKSKKEAEKIIKKAFSQGFSLYNKIENLKDRWYKFKKGKKGVWNLTKGVLRFVKVPNYARIIGREKGYVLFQDFIPNKCYDIRVIVINNKAFAIKRLVREGDFRASGSGHILYEKKHFNEETIKLSLDIAQTINSQCIAIDYIYKNGKPLILEISYGFIKEVYYPCEGYWDKDLNWHAGDFDAQGWMVESLMS